MLHALFHSFFFFTHFFTCNTCHVFQSNVFGFLSTFFTHCFFLCLDKGKATAEENIDHVDKRQLKQVLNESQTSNITITDPGKQASGGVKIISTLQSEPAVDHSRKQVSNVGQTHEKVKSEADDNELASPTWKKFRWTSDVSQSMLLI